MGAVVIVVKAGARVHHLHSLYLETILNIEFTIASYILAGDLDI
jgi:hypothetical protein